MIKHHTPSLENRDDGRSSKLEVPQLISPFNVISFLDTQHSGSNQHGTNTDDEHNAEFLRLDRNDHPDILTKDIQIRTNRHRVHSVIFTFDQAWLTNNTANRRMETMVILRGQSEHCDGAVIPVRR
ncbi:hypothetical protein WICPIJ_008973 [Wickerhamomyces pijperi]|uniref:Uncharacterized protein n=1 Tax=Wickerhamomyces pijperi TaxID=599730 RepID=A0A9P8TG31_WICPI|nr:hypothetical protein WICPIJ_008973 [Wickerhamomyces pijperi]